jgi:CRP-like cAMP-binding protein
VITTDLLALHPANIDATRVLARRLMRLGNLNGYEAEAVCRLVRPLSRVSAYEEIGKDAGRSVSVLLSGLACQVKLLGNGRRQITGLILPGDICDYSFLTGDLAQGPVMALAPCQTGRIALSGLTELCDHHPRIMRAILRGAAAEWAMAQERVISLGLRTALERVAHLLCEMHVRLDAVGLVGDGNSYELPVTQAELGEALGLSTVHVNRTLQVLRRNGTITMRNGIVTIADMDALRREAGFDPGYLGLERSAA